MMPLKRPKAVTVTFTQGTPEGAHVAALHPAWVLVGREKILGDGPFDFRRRLRQVLPGPDAGDVEVVALHPSRRLLEPRVRRFIDLMVEELGR